eukprot:896212-Prymnesium_polylepis.1
MAGGNFGRSIRPPVYSAWRRRVHRHVLSRGGHASARAPATARATPSARPVVASPMTSRRCGEATR